MVVVLLEYFVNIVACATGSGGVGAPLSRGILRCSSPSGWFWKLPKIKFGREPAGSFQNDNTWIKLCEICEEGV
jgi:hypothetical protein